MSIESKAAHRLELLKIARELLNDEYLNRRAEDHNKWIAINDIAKMQNRLRIPYPPFIRFPTAEDILNKAKTLYSFVYNEADDSVTVSFTTEQEVTIDQIHNDMTPDQETNRFLPGWIRRSTNG